MLPPCTLHDQLPPPSASAAKFQIRYTHPISLDCHQLQGGNMDGSDAHPASMVNKIIWSCYVTLDSLISSPVLAGWASDPFMLPPCVHSNCSERLWLHARTFLVAMENRLGWP